VRPLGAGWPIKTCIFRGFGAQKTISSYSFDRIVLIFRYILERTNTKILSSHFFCNFHLEHKLWRHQGRNFRFWKSCRTAMRFSPLDSSEDFMGWCGLRFSLSLIVSELWRHQWRHNERCGLHPPSREPRSVAAIFVFCFSTILIVVVYVVLVVYLVFLISILFYHFIWCALLPE